MGEKEKASGLPNSFGQFKAARPQGGLCWLACAVGVSSHTTPLELWNFPWTNFLKEFSSAVASVKRKNSFKTQTLMCSTDKLSKTFRFSHLEMCGLRAWKLEGKALIDHHLGSSFTFIFPYNSLETLHSRWAWAGIYALLLTSHKPPWNSGQPLFSMNKTISRGWSKHRMRKVSEHFWKV